MSPVEKPALLAALLRSLDDDIAVGTAAALASREAATHEEAKPENDKDTRAIEASYLAGAQAERVRDLVRIASALRVLELKDFGEGATIQAGALIEAESEEGTTLYFFAPQGGGRRATIGGREVVIVTPQSPLGQALFGKSRGDVIEVRTPQGPREIEVAKIY